jgi:hypothetical protein
LTWILILATAGRRGTDSHSLIVRIGDERQAKSSCCASGRIGGAARIFALRETVSSSNRNQKSSGGEAPEVPEAKDSFIVRERSGNLIQGGFEHSEKIDV